MKKTIIVAECGCNHMGNLDLAKEMIREAHKCGCDFVKFQKRDIGCLPDALAKKPYENQHSFGKTYKEHREFLEFDEFDWAELVDTANANYIGIFGTAFDLPSAEFLTSLNTPYLKIGSMQCRDTKFLSDIRKLKNRPPIILSTGMCDSKDIHNAMWALSERVEILVHTTSSYPCPEEDVNLRVLDRGIAPQGQFREFKWGLSGHYAAGNGAIEAAAVALGAVYIERHFTLDRTWKGTDQAASLEPSGMVNVVKAIRSVERALGDGNKRIMPSEIPIIQKLNCR